MKYWLLASRPKTLTAAAAPVMVALSLAFHDYCNDFTVHFHGYSFAVALLCVLFAMVMQVDANFINDYFDFRRGNDDKETRLGPERACSMGWIKPEAMLRAIVITTIVSAVIGLLLLYFTLTSPVFGISSIEGLFSERIIRIALVLILIGGLCILFCFLYTTHLSYKGLGDALVIVFFGLVPVMATYFCLMGRLSFFSLLAGLSIGIVIDSLLIVNNYRDIDNDRRDGKRTLAVVLGRKSTLRLFLSVGFLGSLCWLPFIVCEAKYSLILPLVLYLMIHTATYSHMKSIGEGRQLNRILGETSRNNFLFAIIITVFLLFIS